MTKDYFKALCALFILIFSAGISSAYSQADLAGTWKGNTVGGRDWWNVFELEVNGSGDISFLSSLGCEGETTIPTVAGALQLGGNGTISMNGDAWFRGVLNNDKDTIVFSDGNCHDAQLGMLVKGSANYVQEDLRGIWKGHNVGGQDWWDVFELEIDSSGNISFSSSLKCDGDTTLPTVAGALQLAANGTISMVGDPSFHGVLNNDKDMITFTSGECDHAQLGMLVKSRVDCVQEDLRGIWKGSTVGGRDWWNFSELEIDSSGNISFSSSLTCDGNTTLPTVAGKMQLAKNGTIIMVGDPSFHGVLNNEKDMITFTSGECDHVELGVLFCTKKSSLTQKSAEESSATETIAGRKIILTNVVMDGDFKGVLDFDSFEIVQITTGSFANEGFSRGSFHTELEGIPYHGEWKGMVFYKPDERKMYLKGSVSGEIAATVQGTITESTPGSNIYDRYSAEWEIGQLADKLTSVTLHLDGKMVDEEKATCSDTELYILQTKLDGEVTGHYEGPIDVVLTHVRINDPNNPYYGDGFSLLSYHSQAGAGQVWLYNEVLSPEKTVLNGLSSSPYRGVVAALLDQHTSPNEMLLIISRIDLGSPPAPDLNVRVWGPESVSPGETYNYIVEYRNDGLKDAENCTVSVWPTVLSTVISASAGASVYSDSHLVEVYPPKVPARTNGYFVVKVQTPWGLPAHTLLFGQSSIHASPEKMSPADELFNQIFDRKKGRMWREITFHILDGTVDAIPDADLLKAAYTYLSLGPQGVGGLADKLGLLKWIFERRDDSIGDEYLYWTEVYTYISGHSTDETDYFQNLEKIAARYGYSLESTSFEHEIRTAHDPNVKYGPEGNVFAGQNLDYRIEYENEGEGTAFGVYFTDVIDNDLDGKTLEIGPVVSTLNGSIIAPPGDYDPDTRTVTWLVGTVGSKEGGYSELKVRVKNDVMPGTEVINFATVYFPSVPEETRTNGVVSIIGLDTDADGIPDSLDNCPAAANPEQLDGDSDGVGDLCDGCPSDSEKSVPGYCGCGVADDDQDQDGVMDCIDNCPAVANPEQKDSNGDKVGDACETGGPIIIDGCDTKVEDKVYQGKLISEWIDGCANSAKNHGKFVSCVADLTNNLKKAKVITNQQKASMQNCAARGDMP